MLPKMEDLSAEDTRPKEDEEGEGEGKTAKEVQLEQVQIQKNYNTVKSALTKLNHYPVIH